jgi:hypothetical protein
MSSQDEVSYGVWTKPGVGFSVRYALPAFHEIEFVVGEGYRRIPHGGIENGGLLFGRREADGIAVSAFRIIECEHAFGPSFVLSENDIQALRNQLESYKADPEIGSLEVLGWFISHSRSDLRVTERERDLFNDLFPDAQQVTLLVKPEKFKPTRFAFAIRDADQGLHLDLTQNSFILPLPTRPERESAPEGEPIRRRRRSRIEEIRSMPVADDAVPAKPVLEGQASTHERTAALDPVPAIERMPLAPLEPAPLAAPEPIRLTTESAPPQPLTQPATSVGQTPATPPSRYTPDWASVTRYDAGGIQPAAIGPSNRNPIWAAVLASVCLVMVSGFRFYCNHLLPPLTLAVSPVSDTSVTVSWPPAQTADADSAILTVWRNGYRQDHMLTQEEMQAGAFLLRNADQVIVQLWAHHWYVNRYGNIRVVMPRIAPPPTQPSRVVRPRLRVLP